MDIWKRLDGSKSIGEIVGEIKQEYRNVSESVETEIFEFIEKLAKRGLIGISSTL